MRIDTIPVPLKYSPLLKKLNNLPNIPPAGTASALALSVTTGVWHDPPPAASTEQLPASSAARASIPPCIPQNASSNVEAAAVPLIDLGRAICGTKDEKHVQT